MAAKSTHPHYALHLSAVKQAIKVFKDNGILVFFPVKSCPKFEFLSVLSGEVDGFEISNVNEFNLIKPLLKNKNIGVTAASPKADDLRGLGSKMPKAGIITLQSQRQVNWVSGKREWLLRINPYESRSGAVEFSSRFGFDFEELDHLAPCPWLGSGFSGFSTHFGFQPKSVLVFLNFLKKLSIFCQDRNIKPQILNLGGGWHNIAESDIQLIALAARQLFSGSEIRAEPGSVLFKGALDLKAKIIDVHSFDDLALLQIDASFFCHAKWSSPRPDIGFDYSLNKTKKFNFKIWFCGSTCSEQDRIGPYWIQSKNIKKIQNQKAICFSNLTGYSLAWNNSFNGVEPAKLIFRK